MDIKDIEKLANLSRIYLKDEEKKDLLKDIDNILEFVGQILMLDQEIDFIKPEHKKYKLRNVLREDKDSHESGIYTKDVLANAPQTKDGYIRVKNIL